MSVFSDLVYTYDPDMYRLLDGPSEWTALNGCPLVPQDKDIVGDGSLATKFAGTTSAHGAKTTLRRTNGNSEVIQFSGHTTWSFMVNIMFDVVPTVQKQLIICGTNPTNDDFNLYFDNGNFVFFRRHTTGGETRVIQPSYGTFLPDTLYQMCITDDGVNMHMYINGVHYGSTLSSTTSANNGESLAGYNWFASSPDPRTIQGYLAHMVVLYDHAWDQTEVTELWDARDAQPPVEPPVESTKNIWAGDNVSPNQGQRIAIGISGQTIIG